ncbi:MAG: TonB-dependent receptor [Mediterranea sp.]|jgi:outer membrane receptor protein involved in Fe transport|nr:TonB-dependent receptor [Mediterranea sp.]
MNMTIYTLLGVLLPTITLSANEANKSNALESDTLSTVWTDTVKWRTVDLNEVLVVGFKESKQRQEPLSASSLSSNFLRNRNIQNVRELSTVLPNFYMPDYGSRQTSPIYIRGIGSKVNAPSVGLYVDGVPHFERSALDIDLSDISNVEVLRGPQGTLYGRNAIGGIINIYTYSPLEYQNTRVRVGYGSRNDVQAGASNYTKLSEHVGFSVSGNYHHNDGFFTNLYTGKKADNMDEANGRLSVVWKPAERWNMRLSGSANYVTQGGYPYGVYDAKTGELQPVNYNDPSSYRRTVVTSGLNLRYDGNRIGFNSQTAYQYIRDRQAIDQDFTPADKTFVTQRLQQNMVSQEFTLKSTTEGWYQHLTGVFGFYQGVDKNVENRSAGTVKHYDIPTLGVAFYHQSTFRIYKGVAVLAGVRYDYEYARERNAGSRLRFSQLTPKLTLQYRTPNSQLLYAAVSRGYKAGGFNTAFQSDDERTFNPEYNWNYELGTKLSFWQQRFTADLAIFYIDWRHQQVTQMIPGVGNLQRNAGHSVSKGVELSLQVRPAGHFVVGVNYGYTHARFLQYVRDEKTDYSHRYLPMVPQHTLSVTADYSLYRPCRAIDRLTFGGSVTGAGCIYWQEDNAVSQPFYALLSLKASATKGRFTWEVWSRNLTDTTYNTYYFTLSGSGYAQRGKPLTIGTSIIINI